MRTPCIVTEIVENFAFYIIERRVPQIENWTAEGSTTERPYAHKLCLTDFRFFPTRTDTARTSVRPSDDGQSIDGK